LSSSAGGNSDYGPGLGWDVTDWNWTVTDGHTGLVIECRVYSNPGDTVWIDDFQVTAPDHCWIQTPHFIRAPGGEVIATEHATMGQAKALYR
jgi:hypothetical protein